MSEITMGQLRELITQSEAGRVTRDLLQEFLRDPSRFAARSGQPSAGGAYPVTIDYGKSLAEMVVAGHYDWSNDDINATNFKVDGTGVVAVDLELVHLNKVVNSEAVLAHLEANGLRPATLAELLAFGATYPEIQREFPVIALGSFYTRPGGYRRVPYRGGGGSRRELNLNWFDNDWNENCRFLAVRKYNHF